jgi:hypothetical protein
MPWIAGLFWRRLARGWGRVYRLQRTTLSQNIAFHIIIDNGVMMQNAEYLPVE